MEKDTKTTEPVTISIDSDDDVSPNDNADETQANKSSTGADSPIRDTNATELTNKKKSSAVDSNDDPATKIQEASSSTQEHKKSSDENASEVISLDDDNIDTPGENTNEDQTEKSEENDTTDNGQTLDKSPKNSTNENKINKEDDEGESVKTAQDGNDTTSCESQKKDQSVNRISKNAPESEKAADVNSSDPSNDTDNTLSKEDDDIILVEDKEEISKTDTTKDDPSDATQSKGDESKTEKQNQEDTPISETSADDDNVIFIDDKEDTAETTDAKTDQTADEQKTDDKPQKQSSDVTESSEPSNSETSGQKIEDDIVMIDATEDSAKQEEKAKDSSTAEDVNGDIVMADSTSSSANDGTASEQVEPTSEIDNASISKTEKSASEKRQINTTTDPEASKQEENKVNTDKETTLSKHDETTKTSDSTSASKLSTTNTDLEANKEEIKSTEISKTSKNVESQEKESSDDKSPSKVFVLDEKSGTFEEKDILPDDKVPLLVTGDSDEDVVMIEAATPSKNKPLTSAEKVVESAKKLTATTTPVVKKTETSTKPTPGSSNIECINSDCSKGSKQTAPAPSFVLNFLGIPKKSKRQRVCVNCYDEIVLKYADLCGTIVQQQPLLFSELPQKNELVEISDSSEEDEDEETKREMDKPVSADVIALIESELDDILTSTFDKINIGQQVDWTEQILKQKIAYNSKISDEINNELNELQRKVDRIHLALYSKSRPRYQDLPPCNIFHEVDLVQRNQQQTGTPMRQFSPQKQLPMRPLNQVSITVSVPPGQPAKKEEFVRPAIVVGQFYFAVKHKLLSNWAECQVIETMNPGEKALYKVNFLFNHGGGGTAPVKIVPAKYLAYRHSFNLKLPLGTRVIARFDAGTTQPAAKQSHLARNSSFYPGIIAESFGKYNKHRYLIFFDDGYAQYVNHGDVRVVCEESSDVWLDIHPHSQEFIRNYLQNYRSQRPMVQVKVGQRIITEWKGKWIYAKVVDIDASLVQLHFPDDNRYEWIYRGSTRLGPLYQEKALSMNKLSNNKFSKFQKRNEPSIEYITLDDDDEEQKDAKKPTPQEQALQNYQQNKTIPQHFADAAANRSVAKKSTFHRPAPASQPSAVFMNSSTIYCEDDRPKGKIVYYTAKKHLPPLKYKPHDCNPGCLFKITHNLKSYSPLAKPLLSGWERQLCKMKYKKVFVVYRAPCGRRLRNMYELHKYLRMTKAALNVENFDFDPMIHCLAEYVIENHIYHNPDLSDGKEFMAIPCVNYFDDTKPPPCIYSTERIPTEGVNLNLDSDFLCGCDCEDDCLDKNRCQCWQLTIAGAKFGNPSTSVDEIGYVYKRLQETVVTGIYECNSRCKCKSNCLNRVVQHPLQTKLQVFKTSNRGWGIRCLNDVSKGSFICIYSGHLLTEEAGNMICQRNENKAGDEYFADLDYIETVEQLKEGYESDVVETESELESDEAEYDNKRDSDASDDDFTSNCNPSSAVVKTRSQVRRDSTKKTDPKKAHKKKEDTKDDSDDEREMVSLMPNADMTKGDDSSPSLKYRSVRKLFGKHEQIYIMDAKKSGNLGRYFNHSCNPNLFVQNVFVDTHDLRFPWVAFFALCNIRAGTELSWNYNYDVGSVPGKVLYCQCGAENCRQRLL